MGPAEIPLDIISFSNLNFEIWKGRGLLVKIQKLSSQVKLILYPKQREKPAASRTRTCTNAAVFIASGECPSRFDIGRRMSRCPGMQKCHPRPTKSLRRHSNF